MEIVEKFLIENPLLLLFIVLAGGYAIGQLKIFGFSLGVAAVLFVGLGAGALHPDLKLPDIVYRLGLILFVYTVGLSSGPGFFASFKRKGLRDNFFVLTMICFATILTLIFHQILKVDSPTTAGLFAGSLTSTPALAGSLDLIKELNAGKSNLNLLISEPVTAYSIAYPMGVIGMLLSIFILQKIWKVDYQAEIKKLQEVDRSLGSDNLVSLTVEVLNSDLNGQKPEHIFPYEQSRTRFIRILSQGKLTLVNSETVFQTGDLLTVLGSENDVREVIKGIGKISEYHLDTDRSEYDFRRIFISNREIFGKKIGELNLKKYGAMISRVRRGDIDFLAEPEIILEPGDRIRVVAPHERMKEISAYFGDSIHKLSEIDILSFSLGIALGLLLGSIPIPLPQGTTFKLGFAGGVLLVGLILGKIGKTGPFLWQIPYNANLTLRQLGIVLFLAGIGTISGYSFFNTISQGNGFYLFLSGLIITFATALITLTVGYKILKIPMGVLIGMLSGLQTQPALLAFSGEQTKNNMPDTGYSTVYPFAMIAKIIIAQLLIIYLG